MSETLEQDIQEQEVQGQAPATEAPTEPQAPTETAGEKKTPWEIRRINAMTRQMREAERRAELAERRNQELAARLAAATAVDGDSAPTAASARPAITPEAFENAVNARAAEQAFNTVCNNIYREGVDTFEDFGERIENFRKIGGMQPALVEIAQELGNPAKILYDLAADPDEAARIMELPPARMAAAVAKLVAKPPVKAAAPSKAPPPITRVTGTASPEPDPEKMSAKEWREWREAEVAKKKGRR